jgi:hypothetical protein
MALDKGFPLCYNESLAPGSLCSRPHGMERTAGKEKMRLSAAKASSKTKSAERSEGLLSLPTPLSQRSPGICTPPAGWSIGLTTYRVAERLPFVEGHNHGSPGPQRSGRPLTAVTGITPGTCSRTLHWLRQHHDRAAIGLVAAPPCLHGRAGARPSLSCDRAYVPAVTRSAMPSEQPQGAYKPPLDGVAHSRVSPWSRTTRSRQGCHHQSSAGAGAGALLRRAPDVRRPASSQSMHFPLTAPWRDRDKAKPAGSRSAV